MNSSSELTIGELADAANLSRRAVRFYVQQKLLPLPHGRGRGSHYDESHLQRLHEIAQLQQTGHSLEAIRRILSGEPPPAASNEVSEAPRQRAKPKPVAPAELWTRLRLAEGVELHFDATRFNPPPQRLIELREVVRQLLETQEE